MRTSSEFRNIPDTEQEKDFSEKKRNFFQNFAMRYKEHLKMFREFGLLPRQKMDSDINPKTGKQFVTGDPLEHCIVEAVAADTIAKTIGMTEEERETLVVGALLHDFYKREDIVEAITQQESGQKAEYEFEATSNPGSAILRDRGYNEDVIQITESVGHQSLKRIVSGQASLQELIMHYIDDITVNTEIRDLDSRIDYLESNPLYNELNQAGRREFGGKTTFQVQREIGHEVQKILAPYFGLNPEDSSKLPEVINQRIRERIME